MTGEMIRFMRQTGERAELHEAAGSYVGSIATMENTVRPLGSPKDLSFDDPQTLEEMVAKHR